MAKEVLSYSYRGILNFSNGTILEEGKEEDKLYDFITKLQQWDGQSISLSFKLDTEPQPLLDVSEESDEDTEW